MGAAISQSNSGTSYEPYNAFEGHTKPINCLRFCPDGYLLASGGDDSCVRIWSLRARGHLIQVLKCTVHGPVTDLRWNADGADLHLLFACADGTIHFYHRSSEMGSEFKPVFIIRAHSSAIKCMDYDPVRRRLATVGGGSVKVWAAEEDDPSTMRSIAVRASQGFVARSVHFAESGKVVMVGFLDSHQVHAYSVEPWKLLWNSLAFTRIGNTALSSDGEHLLVHNLSAGVDAYSLPSMTRKATYLSQVTRRYPKQVAFAARDTLVVHGSDSGVVYVYDFASTELLQQLHHTSGNGLVQTVTTFTGNGMHFIASGIADQDFSIKVWAKKKVVRIQEPALVEAGPRMSWVAFLLWAIAICFIAPHYTKVNDMMNTIGDGMAF
ncbi:hypothetical protein M422DRAFT_43557 [Sphaerobolus stellatus SS14]|nr:hypothetical protein M422DRAFT_43557 [Sphaerobolus stellatus SS14]